MKKTTKTSKLVLDRQTIRQLTNVELKQPGGGMAEDTFFCKTESCHGGCNLSVVCGSLCC